jgi:fermentation-respiration switch protein FrsA (DUF1100 family)
MPPADPIDRDATTEAPVPAKRPRTWRWHLLRAVVLYVVTPYLAVMVILVVFQRRLIFQPTTTERLLAMDVASAEGTVEDVEIAAANGLMLLGWRFRTDSTDGADKRFLVIYFPGNAGCRRDRIADCRDFTRLGCDVLLFDYRGYGDNAGSPSEVHFAADAQRVWQFATTELQFPPERIVIFGESLGGAVATRLVAEVSRAGTPPAALILNSTFASMGDSVAWHHPYFPFRHLLFDRFPSLDRMPHVACPLLQFHGTADDIVPFAHGRRLFDAAAKAPTNGVANRFVAIEGGRHNFITMGDMQSAVGELLGQLREQHQAGPTQP